jgi:hypothetical protein
MPQHKFKIGQRVKFFRRGLNQNSAREEYRITRLLPAEGAGFQYRIKGTTKGQERVVTESEIA